MNAAIVCLFALIAFSLGYKYYSKFLSEYVFNLRDDEQVPSKELNDGIDYVPTNKHVLFGHHYSSIAGAAPIIGPAIAVIWGWVPAVIWVIFGTIFMGAVHDFSTLIISMRHKGQSIGSISAHFLSEKSRTLFLLVIFSLILLVSAVFAKAIASLFVAHPATVIPINFEIIIAVIIGYSCYKKGLKIFWPSILALLSLYAMIYVGLQFPISLSNWFGSNETIIWIVFLFIYSFIASSLPVWLLLQPRDLINSHQLFFGLFALILGIFITQPAITAPAFNITVSDAPPMIPFLFVTIACGAISGFHGLVSSGTSSKQIECATDARSIGYGAMLGEGLLALIATLAVSAGLSNWAEHYHSFGLAASSGVKNFVNGAATFLTGLYLPVEASKVVIAVLVISFAATSLDTAVRIQRYIIQELGAIYQISILQHRTIAGGIAVVLPLILCLFGKEKALWPLFGASNQLLAGLSLLVVTIWLKQEGKPWLYTGVPMIIVLGISGIALFIKLISYISSGNYLLAFAGVGLLALFTWILFEAFSGKSSLNMANSEGEV